MKKHIVSVCALALVSGCASFAPPPPLLIPASIEASSYKDVLVRLQEQQALYLRRADELAGENGWIVGLSIASSIATLGFAAYDSPHDNVVAAALISGAANSANTTLKPGEGAVFYSGGASTLGCVYGASRLVRSHYGALEGADPFASPSQALIVYEVKRLQLADLIAEAEKQAKAAADESKAAFDDLMKAVKAKSPTDAPSQRLQTATAALAEVTDAKLSEAIAAAKEADSKLQVGIKAQRDLLETMVKAMEDTHALVTKRSPPSLKSLLDSLSKIELPKAEPATSATPAAKDAFDSLKKSDVFQADMMSASRSATDMAVLLRKEADAVKNMEPERDAAGIKQMSACVVSFGASGPAPPK